MLSDLIIQRSGVSRVQALYITALSDEQVTAPCEQDAIVRKSRFAGSASCDSHSRTNETTRPRLGVGRLFLLRPLLDLFDQAWQVRFCEREARCRDAVVFNIRRSVRGQPDGDRDRNAAYRLLWPMMRQSAQK
jgi:hypothetical protein